MVRLLPRRSPLPVLVMVALGACEPPRSDVCAPDRACASASTATCAEGPEGRLYGRSAFVDGTCAARDDQACESSLMSCALWGQCSAPTSFAGGSCGEAQPIPDRDRDFLASRNVACGAGRTCVAMADKDCRAAEVCKLEGRCTAKNGVCVATSDADCRAAAYCPEVGWCSLVSDAALGSRCSARSADDCRPSRACDDWGQCGVAPGGDGCTTCERSLDCTQEGRCERVLSGDRCQVTQDRHCQRSAACRSEGRCRLVQGACTR